jgi:undecaprenyl-diphosphatase
MDIAHAPVWFQAVVLGLIQGIAEFLPISSSGHLVLLPALTHWEYLGKEFDVALHLGTLLAIVLYFREDVKALIGGTVGLFTNWRFMLYGPPKTEGEPEGEPARGLAGIPFAQRLSFLIIVASIPAGLLGLFLDDWLEAHFNHVGSIAFFLAAFAILMYFAERAGSQRFELTELTLHGAIMIGLAQACALMPGVSRSGSTMTMALLLGLTRAEAARFSFLMALPITAAACLLKGIKMVHHMAQSGDTGPLVPCFIGIVVSAVSGWLCIHFLMRYLRTQTFTPFVIYRLLLAAALLAWMWSH